jgi:ACT domain-containing protein
MSTSGATSNPTEGNPLVSAPEIKPLTLEERLRQQAAEKISQTAAGKISQIPENTANSQVKAQDKKGNSAFSFSFFGGSSQTAKKVAETAKKQGNPSPEATSSITTGKGKEVDTPNASTILPPSAAPLPPPLAAKKKTEDLKASFNAENTRANEFLERDKPVPSEYNFQLLKSIGVAIKLREAMSEEINLLTTLLEQAKTLNGTQSTTIKRLGGELAALETERDLLRTNLAEIKGQLEASTANNESLSLELETSKAMIEEKDTEIDSLKAEGGLYNSGFEAAKVSLKETFNEEKETLQMQAEELSQKVAGLTDSLNTQSSELSTVKDQIPLKDKEISGLTLKVSSLESQLKDAKNTTSRVFAIAGVVGIAALGVFLSITPMMIEATEGYEDTL